MSKKIIGDVDLSNLYLKRLPDILKDITVSGNFGCNYNNLTSLEGAPKTVGGDFYCGFNTVKFTEAQVRAICDVKGDVYV